MEMFEEASRRKLRFDSPRGLLSVEDLWDLPLTSPSGNRANLDSIAIDLHRATRDVADTVSFVTPSKEDAGKAELQLKFEVVKYVIGVRVAERDALKAASDRREKKQRLLELISRKEDQELEGKSVEELRTLAESL
jgi:hypothetical protein